MARPILQLEATEEEVLELGRLVRGTKVSVGYRFRARIILHRLYRPNRRVSYPRGVVAFLKTDRPGNP